MKTEEIVLLILAAWLLFGRRSAPRRIYPGDPEFVGPVLGPGDDAFVGPVPE